MIGYCLLGFNFCRLFINPPVTVMVGGLVHLKSDLQLHRGLRKPLSGFGLRELLQETF